MMACWCLFYLAVSYHLVCIADKKVSHPCPTISWTSLRIEVYRTLLHSQLFLQPPVWWGAIQNRIPHVIPKGPPNVARGFDARENRHRKSCKMSLAAQSSNKYWNVDPFLSLVLKNSWTTRNTPLIPLPEHQCPSDQSHARLPIYPWTIVVLW